MRRNLRLAVKLLARDWRSGELTLLVAALAIAVASATAVSLLGARLTRTMELQAAQFLAADLAVSGHETPPSAWREEGERRGLSWGQTSEFSTVLSEKDEVLLVGVKAATDRYPLRGQLKVALAEDQPAVVAEGIPAVGEAWVDARIPRTLGLKRGDLITVGERELRITRLLVQEPDRRGDLYSLAPRVLINAAELPATRVIQPGSHVHYNALFAGDPASLLAFKSWLKPRLHAGQRIADVHEERPEVGSALTRAQRYLGLASVAVVLIAGVAIATSARRYTERHFDLVAMLKCLGSRERDVLVIFVAQFVLIGVAASLLGCGLGYAVQAGMAAIFADLLPDGLAAPGPLAWLLGVASGLLVFFGFTIPPLLRLKRIAPLRTLRRDLTPLPSSAWLAYGCALVALATLLWRYTDDWRLTGTVLCYGGGALLILALAGRALLAAMRPLATHLPLRWRWGFKQLTRDPAASVKQILAFAVTLAAMQVTLTVRDELIGEWQRQLPADTPNHFALNLFDADLPLFSALLAEVGRSPSAYYPIVRGRLTHLNGRPVSEIVSKNTSAEGAINRELSLTWSDRLPADNQILEGAWWPESAGSTGPAVSVEAGFARGLGARLGDSLRFDITGRVVDARVVSFRSVRWDSMSPNFFVMFAPGGLDGFAHTWLTSFHLPAEQQSVLPKLVKACPAVTLLEVDALLKQVQGILGQLTRAVEYILGLALIAGFLVLFAAVRATLDERLRDHSLLRALGASRAMLNRAQWLEFSALGLLAGLLAAIAAELILWGLFTRVLQLSYRVHYESLLALPVLAAGLIGLAGYLMGRRVLETSPTRMLQGHT